jgi:DNA-binding transcriptional regulator YiaG
MPDLAATLKAEISRLARKEIRKCVTSIQKTVAQQRREIAHLKRQLGAHERRIAVLEAQERQRVAEFRTTYEPAEGARFSTRSVKAQRRRLKLSAEQFGKLLGVSAQTIYNWEQGRTRPGKAQFASLVALREIGRKEALRRLRLLDAS